VKKLTSIVVLALMIMMLIAPQVLATNGMQFIGVGAYQKGMGGAVTAAPYTSATAITNPAGMALIGKRADFSAELFMPERYVDFANLGGEKSTGGSELYMAPAIGWTAPSWFNEDIYFGGGMYGIGGMGVDYDEVGLNFDSGMFGMAPGTPVPGEANIWSNYQFWKMAPSMACKVNDKLAIGGALNIDYQFLNLTDLDYIINHH
jgi:long-chain fatty acid transport protein